MESLGCFHYFVCVRTNIPETFQNVVKTPLRFSNDKMPMRENTLFPFIPGNGRKYANLGTLDLAF